MSTNFYAVQRCDHCNTTKVRHIGKSAKGSLFQWNGYGGPHDPGHPTNATAWIEWLMANPRCIVNEYEDSWSLEAFLLHVEAHTSGRMPEGAQLIDGHAVSHYEFS